MKICKFLKLRIIKVGIVFKNSILKISEAIKFIIFKICIFKNTITGYKITKNSAFFKGKILKFSVFYIYI